MSEALDGYPKTLSLDGIDVVLRPVEASDVEAIQQFANAIPEHDLLFLSRDICHPRVIDAWLKAAERGELHSLIALSDGAVIGGSALVRDPLGWSRHVGEIRLLVSSAVRGRGVGGALLLETFRIALLLGVAKLVARMTPDQTGAIALFMGMGFRGEAMLKDHVMDRAGRLFDLAILSHQVGNADTQEARSLETAP